MGAVLQFLMSFLTDYKTYTAAVGLFGFALYQFSTAKTAEDYDRGIQSLFAALGLLGLRHAQSKTETKVLDKADQQTAAVAVMTSYQTKEIQAEMRGEPPPPPPPVMAVVPKDELT